MTLTIPQSLAIKAVRAYKMVVSPWLPSACRFTPTCSEYALEALEGQGFVRGVISALGRLLRCHPLHRGGFDPLR
jgi:uncharacterized protein